MAVLLVLSDFLILLCPSNFALASMVNSSDTTSPVKIPPLKTSTVLQSALPSNSPFTTNLSALKSPFIYPLFPITIRLFDKNVPSK